MPNVVFLVFVWIAGLISACASNPHSRYDGSSAIPKSGSEKLNDVISHVEIKDPDDFEEEDIAPPQDEITETLTTGIPVEINDLVEEKIEYFVNDRERFQRFLDRGETYRSMVLSVLKDQELPPDLFYLAMIESGYVTTARSHAAAVGIWQFIRGTGKRYGLTINGYVDERQDPMRATVAAALYLKDLHNVFNSWYLAMAAYNAGESRIMNAIMKANSRDFWTLVKKRALPSETMNYIPKFLAAVIIGHDPHRYGFRQPQKERWPALEPVEVPAPVKLSRVASTSGVELTTLRKYNPHLRRDMTPPGRKTYRLWVPQNVSDLVANAAPKLASFRVKARLAATGEARYHRVRKGENLSLIARKYRTSIARLKQWNRLRGNRIYAGQRLKVGAGTAGRRIVYKVRSGDTLAAIARKHRTTVSKLKKLNGLRGSRIYAGQRLKVAGTAVAKNSRTKYRVRKGDTLGKIARKFGTTIHEIKKVNRLRRSTIYAGQILKVANKRG